MGWENVLWTHEKIFTVEAKYNSQNTRVLASKSSAIPSQHRRVSRTQKPAQVMVWAGVSAKGLTELIFVDSGVKMNQESY